MPPRLAAFGGRTGLNKNLFGLVRLGYRKRSLIFVEWQKVIASRTYTVSDGEMVLSLEPQRKVVTS